MKRYVCSRHLELERRDLGEVTLVNARMGSRLQLNAPSYEFLRLFEEPTALEDLGELGDVERARPTFELLRRASFLVEEGRQESIYDRVLERRRPGFFGCPSAGLKLEPGYDALLLGVPFDYGNHKEPGTRFGPQALRAAAALDYHFGLDLKTERPRGWYDNDRGRTLLEGVRLGDRGDVSVLPNEAPERVFGKMRGVVEEILAVGALPVAVGGDHSITYPLVAAHAQPLSILHIDAHSDLAPCFGGVENHHGNVLSRLLALGHVRAAYQIGLRGTTPVSQQDGRRGVALMVPPRRLRAIGVDGLIAALPKDESYYVSFDIDVLDPSCAPGTSTPVPGGLGFEEAKDLLIAIASSRRCVGFDLVEVNPRRDVNEVTVVIALELMLAFLGAHFEAKERCRA